MDPRLALRPFDLCPEKSFRLLRSHPSDCLKLPRCTGHLSRRWKHWLGNRSVFEWRVRLIYAPYWISELLQNQRNFKVTRNEHHQLAGCLVLWGTPKLSCVCTLLTLSVGFSFNLSAVYSCCNSIPECQKQENRKMRSAVLVDSYTNTKLILSASYKRAHTNRNDFKQNTLVFKMP